MNKLTHKIVEKVCRWIYRYNQEKYKSAYLDIGAGRVNVHFYGGEVRQQKCSEILRLWEDLRICDSSIYATIKEV